MISFMVIGGPRSATTWLANLLTTDHTLCLHDPLLEYKSTTLETMKIPGIRRLGIADSSALLYPDWLENHKAKKILLWRDPREINTALNSLGLPELDPQIHAQRIRRLPKGVKAYPWDAVFNAGVCAEICTKFDVPFNRWRFEELKKMNVQPQFSRLPIDAECLKDQIERIVKGF